MITPIETEFATLKQEIPLEVRKKNPEVRRYLLRMAYQIRRLHEFLDSWEQKPESRASAKTTERK